MARVNSDITDPRVLWTSEQSIAVVQSTWNKSMNESLGILLSLKCATSGNNSLVNEGSFGQFVKVLFLKWDQSAGLHLDLFLPLKSDDPDFLAFWRVHFILTLEPTKSSLFCPHLIFLFFFIYFSSID